MNPIFLIQGCFVQGSGSFFESTAVDGGALWPSQPMNRQSGTPNSEFDSTNPLVNKSAGGNQGVLQSL